MGSSVAISLDAFRRQRKISAETSVEPVVHPLVGQVMGLVERRFGLIRSHEPIHITDVYASSGDLAVADRYAFLAASENSVQYVVVECDGVYLACRTDLPIDLERIPTPTGDDPQIRVMSIVSPRGITPALGPLN